MSLSEQLVVSVPRVRLADTLMAAVGARRLMPGASYSLSALSDALGTRPATVRAAMADLAADGIVTPTPDDLYHIHDPSPADLRGMIDVRLMLEVPAVRLIADRGVEPGGLRDLYAMAAGTMSAATRGDVLGYINGDMDFHLRLIGQVGNQRLVDTVRVLRSRSRLHAVRDADISRFMTIAAGEHADLLELIEHRRPTAAGELLARHIQHVTEYWDAGPADGET